MNIARTLADRAAAAPDRVAVRLGARSVTYGELDARVDAAARLLQDAGLQAGDRLALVVGNRVTAVVALYAGLRAGLVVVPVGTALTSSEIGQELTDCRARAIVIGRAYVGGLEALRGTLPDLEHVWVADTDADVDPDSGMRGWSAAVADVGDARPHEAAVDEDDLALLAYTSGTTGSPKGAMLTHGQLLANQAQLRDSGMAVRDTDVVLLALPLFHIYGLNVGLGATLSGGGTLELVERFEPASTLQLIADRGVTVVVGAPPMYVAWLNTPGAGEVDLSTVRLATSGAAPLPPAVLARCADELGLDVREGYGLTEAAPVVTTSAGLPAAVPGSVGPPLAGVELRIVEDGGEPVEDGDPGRVQVRGPNVFSGYWERPTDSAEVLLPGGWLDTGDIGYLDHDGNLHLVDRVRDLVIVNGFNVYPVEVERVLATHPAVAQAAVIGVPHPYTGEALKAFVVLREGAEATADELIAHSATLLARFKRPESVEFVDDLPTLPTGKVRRRLLRPA
jgi:long-chain acyl-CoA synthetase